MEDDEEREKRQSKDGGIGSQTEVRNGLWLIFEAKWSMHTTSNTQLCGQASDETRVKWSDGGGIIAL